MNSNITVNFKVGTFLFEVYFEEGAPKMYTNQLKNVCYGVHFFDKIAGWGSATLPENAPLQVFSIIFAQICTSL